LCVVCVWRYVSIMFYYNNIGNNDMFNYSLNGVTLRLIRETRYTNAEKECPDVKAEKECPYANIKQECPHVKAERECPYAEAKKECPYTAKKECPLRWCVTYKKKRVYYSTGIKLLWVEWNYLDALYRLTKNGEKIKSNDWDPLNKLQKNKIKDYYNDLQAYYSNRMEKNVRELAQADNFTFTSLNVKLNKVVINTANLAFQSKIDSLMKDEKVGNANVYKCALRSLESFKGNNVLFSEITPEWLKKYQSFMEKNGLRYSSIGMYLRTLRVIVNEARTQGLINPSTYPFGRGKFEIPTGSGREMALTLEDIKKIAAFECQTKTIEMSRDLWLFSFYCNGVNFGDMCRFTFDNIENDEIYFYRKKTFNKVKEKKEIIAPILPPMLDIINKWGSDDQRKSHIFPFLNECTTEEEMKHEISNLIRLVNKQIKIVTKALGLPDLSTYSARHSYATILAKKRVPESYIADQLGHANRTVTQNYFGNYSKEERFIYNSMLL